MSASGDSGPHVQWCIATQSSIIRCEMAPLPNGSCELRVYYGDEIAITETFWAEDSARNYATALHERLLPLSSEIVRHRRAG